MDPITWYHLVVTWRNTSGLNVYVDGVEVAEDITSSNSGSEDSKPDLVLGRANNIIQKSNQYTAYAYYDDMRIYYEEKSAEFISNIL